MSTHQILIITIFLLFPLTNQLSQNSKANYLPNSEFLLKSILIDSYSFGNSTSLLLDENLNTYEEIIIEIQTDTELSNDSIIIQTKPEHYLTYNITKPNKIIFNYDEILNCGKFTLNITQNNTDEEIIIAFNKIHMQIATAFAPVLTEEKKLQKIRIVITEPTPEKDSINRVELYNVITKEIEKSILLKDLEIDANNYVFSILYEDKINGELRVKFILNNNYTYFCPETFSIFTRVKINFIKFRNLNILPPNNVLYLPNNTENVCFSIEIQPKIIDARLLIVNDMKQKFITLYESTEEKTTILNFEIKKFNQSLNFSIIDMFDVPDYAALFYLQVLNISKLSQSEVAIKDKLVVSFQYNYEFPENLSLVKILFVNKINESDYKEKIPVKKINESESENENNLTIYEVTFSEVEGDNKLYGQYLIKTVFDDEYFNFIDTNIMEFDSFLEIKSIEISDLLLYPNDTLSSIPFVLGKNLPDIYIYYNNIIKKPSRFDVIASDPKYQFYIYTKDNITLQLYFRYHPVYSNEFTIKLTDTYSNTVTQMTISPLKLIDVSPKKLSLKFPLSNSTSGNKLELTYSMKPIKLRGLKFLGKNNFSILQEDLIIDENKVCVFITEKYGATSDEYNIMSLFDAEILNFDGGDDNKIEINVKDNRINKMTYLKMFLPIIGVLVIVILGLVIYICCKIGCCGRKVENLEKLKKNMGSSEMIIFKEDNNLDNAI